MTEGKDKRRKFSQCVNEFQKSGMEVCEMYDYVIKRGRIIDGTGNDAYVADLGIRDGKIVFIGDMKGNYDSSNVIDAEGKVVSPGFINMHSHGDQTLFLFPRGESTVKQGITTNYCGNCGATPGPMDKYWVRKFWEYDAWNEVDPYIENANTILPREQVVPVIEKYFGVKIDWETLGQYMAKLEDMGIAYNYIPNVGHGDIRAQVLGGDSRKPDASEMKEMKRYLDQALSEGAWGMTTGMDYAPGNYADLDELTELVSMVKDAGGIYTTHWKNRGRDTKMRIEGLQEAFEVARRTGARLHVNHLSDLYYTEPMTPEETNISRAHKTLKFIDEAQAEGIPFIFDVIPNVDAGFEYLPYLAAYFQPWIRISGSVDQFIVNLKTRDFVDWLRDWIMQGRAPLINPGKFPEWQKWLYITASSVHREYAGKTIAELFDKSRDKDYVETVLRLLKEDPMMRTKSVRFVPEIVKEFLSHDLAMVGIDAFNLDGYGTFGLGKAVPEILTHPNTYYSMVNYLLHYGSDRMEDTIRRITGKPADWLKLDDRGYLKEGYWADINIIDMENLATNENFVDPYQDPSGIDYVFINGTMVIKEGEHTEARPGKVLRRR